VADPAHKERSQISVWSWVKLDSFLARLLVSPFHKEVGQDGRYLHPKSHSLQRKRTIMTLGSLKTPRLEHLHCVRAFLVLDGFISPLPVFFSEITPQRAGSFQEFHRLTSLEFFFSPVYKEHSNMRIQSLKNIADYPEYTISKV
jgi:hypothetical protein